MAQFRDFYHIPKIKILLVVSSVYTKPTVVLIWRLCKLCIEISACGRRVLSHAWIASKERIHCWMAMYYHGRFMFCENISLVHKFDNDRDEILLDGFVETFNSYLGGNWLSMPKMKVM